MQRTGAAYARYSTDLQSDRSVEDQIALCEDFARRSGITIKHRFHDRAQSGATIAGRDGLAAMLAAAVRGDFDVIIVEALDRLSRDQADLAGLYKRLSFLGVDIVAVHDGKADHIQIGIRGLVSALFLDDLKNKTRRGMAGVIEQGRHAGGLAYGYRPTPGEPGVLQIYDPEADVVRRIFDDFNAGSSAREIAHALNAEGVPAPRGAAWGASAIHGNASRGYGVLRNALYDGRLIWNKARMIRHPDTGRRVSRMNPPEQWKEVAVPHLRIVDPDVWQAAQRPRRKYTPGPGRKLRILSGLLKCAKCGSGMAICDKTGGYIGIRCSGRHERGICDNARKYNLRRIEAAVIDGLRAAMTHPEAVRAYVEGFMEARRGEARDRQKAERKLATATAAIHRLNDALIEGRIDAAYFDGKIGALRADEEAARAALADAPDAGPITLHPAAVAAHAAAIETIGARLTDIEGADPEAVRLFRDLIDRVVVHDAADGGVEVEVFGKIGPLVSGGKLVAGARYAPIPPISFGRRAA